MKHNIAIFLEKPYIDLMKKCIYLNVRKKAFWKNIKLLWTGLLNKFSEINWEAES